MRYWNRVFAVVLCFTLFIGGLKAQFSPPNIAGLSLWLRADSGIVQSGGTVSQWSDLSANHVHATQATPGNQPTYILSPDIDSFPAVRFTGGTQQMLSSTGMIPGYGDSSLTIFLLMKGYSQAGATSTALINAGTVNTGLWVFRRMFDQSFSFINNNASGNQTILYGGYLANAGFTYRVLEVQKNLNSNIQMYVNGVLGGAANNDPSLTGPFTNGTYRLGREPNNAITLNGEYAEVIIYTKALTAQQRAQVETYLYNKYAPPVNLGADITSNPTLCPVVLNAGVRFASLLWSTGATTASITVTQSGTYSVTATDIFGRISRDTITVTVPRLKLNHGDTTICAGDSFYLKPVLTTQTGYTKLWSNSLTTDSIKVKTAGTYHVRVTNTASGCSQYTDTITVTLDNFKNTMTLGPDTALCAGNVIGLSSPPSSQWGNLHYLWSNSSTTSTIPVTAAGPYAVTVTDASGCKGKDTINVAISGSAPAVNFTGASLCQGQAYDPHNTTDTSVQHLASFLWNFGDNTTSNQYNPTHTFSAAGTYTVNLKVVSTVGCSNNLDQTVTVNAQPVAAFTGGMACVNSAYQFADQSTVASGQTINQWNWNFGDGNSSAAQNPSHAFTGAGNYNVTLQVTTAAGCTNSVAHTVQVTSGASLPQTFTLQTPANNAAVGTTTNTFSWTPSANAAYYQLIISTDATFATGDSIYNNIFSTQRVVTLPGNQTYYWKVTAYNICAQSSVSAVDTFSIFSPSNLPGLALWLRADSGVVTTGTSVSQWKDQSSNQINAVQANVNKQPTLGVAPELNNMPTIKFNGFMGTGSSYLQSTQAIPGYNTNSLSVFIVAKGNAQNGTSAGLLNVGSVDAGLWIFRRMYTSTYSLLNNGLANNPQYNEIDVPGFYNTGFPYKILGVQKDYGNSVSLLVNGNVGSTLSTDPTVSGMFTNGNYTVGAEPTQSALNGEIAEVLVYTTLLTPTQRQTVENYLYNKYAPPVNLGPDIVENYSFCGRTISAGTRFTSYLWSTGETTSSITVTRNGTYSVSVVDVFGRSSSSSVHVTVPSAKIANGPVSSACMSQTVNIATQLGSTANYTFLWNNGATTSSINIGGVGSYWVKVTDSSGCFNRSDTTTVAIDNFSSTVTLGPDTNLCAGNALGLKVPPTGWGNLQFHWSTGGTDSTIIVTSTNQYCVTVTDVNACSASSCKHVTITGTAPVVNFSGDTMCYGVPFTPTNLSSPAGSITGYSWNFGDGTTSTATNPSHTYNSSGFFNASLTAVNNAGCSNSINKTITVRNLPSVSFTGSAGCISNSYQFTDNTTVPSGTTITQWSWNFGDGGNSNTQNPAHQYAQSGNYNVTLSVTDAEGCSGALTRATTIGGTTGVATTPLTIPADNAVIGSANNIVFAWGNVNGATGYALEIATDNFFGNVVYYQHITGNEDTVPVVTGAQIYYWKVISYNTCGDSSSSFTRSFTIFNPGSLSSCISLWLRADSDVAVVSGKVSTWGDGSGHGYDATQTTPANRPTLVSSVPLLNNMPTISFNGTTNMLTGVQIPDINTSSITTFIVNKGAAETGDPLYTEGLLTFGDRDHGMWIYRRMLYQDYTVINNYINPSNPLVPPVISVPNSMPNAGYQYGLYGMRKDFGHSLGLYINGTLDTLTTDLSASGYFTNDVYKIGHTEYLNTPGFKNLKGEIAEVIMFNCALDDDSRQLVENYIYNKYAPPVYLGQDVLQTSSVCPVTLNTGSRFVNYLWSTGDSTATLTVKQSGTYWVRTVDVFGRTSSDTINVTLPYQGSQPSGDTAVCAGSALTISQLLSSPSSYHYFWSTGASTAQISVSGPGAYSATISDNSGCFIQTDTVFVAIDSFSALQLLTGDTLICSGSQLSVANSGYPIISFLWSNGDTTASPVINSSGNYTVSATDANHCVSHGTANVTTHAHAPTADFTTSNLCLGSTSSFNNQSQVQSPDAISSVVWNFGGGNPSTSVAINGATVYPAFGDYTVTMHLVTDSGCTAAKTKNITVYPSPQAAFNYASSNSAATSTNILCAGTYAVFTDTSIAVGGDAIASSVWKFNGNVNSTGGHTILYQFDQMGVYDVTLIVTNTSGCVDSETQAINVYRPLVADFNYAGVCLGDSTHFSDATASLSIVDRKWDFGDLFTSTLKNPVHKYTAANNYSASLTVQNSIGCISTVTKNINVVHPPVANFGSAVVCINRNYTFVDSTTTFGDDVAYWYWNIANTSSTAASPQYLFADTGTYNVKLRVITAAGCTDSVSRTVQVKPNPVAAFTYTPLYGSAPLNVTFTNNSKGASTYLWQFGDADNSDAFAPQHLYDANGTFNIVLQVVNDFGCKDSLAKTLSIVPTDLDISVDEVTTFSTPQTDGTVLVQLIVQVSNLGTRPITSAHFKATLGTGGVVVQDWTGLLGSGRIMLDTLPVQFDVSQNNAGTYVCVEATSVNDGQTEINYNNNRACAALDGNLQLVGPSPSPAIQKSVLGIVMPAAGQVTVSIFDEFGRAIVKERQLNLPMGRTDYDIPVQQMQAGEYFIRIMYNDDFMVRKLIVK